MSSLFDVARLVREARTMAGLTQRELAQRVGTSQSVVARTERGQTVPTAETVEKLLAAAGFELWVELVPGAAPPGHMLDDVARILSLTPEERLLEVGNIDRFLRSARRA